MRIATTFIAGMVAAALLPAAVIGGAGWWAMAATAERVQDDTARVLLDQERERLQQTAGERAEAVGRLLRDYQRDVAMLRRLAESAVARPLFGSSDLAALYPERDTAGLPAWGFVHPEVGAFADWERRSPVGGVWVRPGVVRRVRADAHRREEVAGLIRALMGISPVLNAVREKQGESCSLVWLVAAAGVNLVSSSSSHLEVLRRDPVLADGDATQLDAFQEFTPERDPSRQGGWMRPYLDPIKREWMSCAVAPIYHGDRFIGTVGADIRLAGLARWLQTLRVGHDGYVFLLSAGGAPLAMPSTAIADLCADPVQRQLLQEVLAEGRAGPGGATILASPLAVSADLQPVVASMAAQENGSAVLPLGGEDKLLAFAPVAETRWSLGLVLPVREAESAARAAHAGIVAGARAGTLPFLLGSLAIALAAGGAGAWISLRLVRPVRRLTHLVLRLGRGGEWHELPPGPGGELAILADSVNRLVREVVEHQGLFRAIFDGVDDAILLFDAHGMTVVMANRRSVVLFGWPIEELRGLSAEQLSAGVAPYTGVEARAWFAQALAGGSPVFPWRARERSGRLRWVEVCLRQVHIGAQSPVVAAVRDIGERMAAQEAVHRGKEEWERTFDAVPDWIAILDRDGLVTNANRALLDALSMPLAQMRGRRFHDLFDLGPNGGGCPCARLDRADGPHRFHAFSPALDRHLHVTVSALVREGQVSGSAHVIRDVTEAVRLEERLRQAARMDAIGQLAGGVAHDFNNQLTGILGFAELLERQVAGEPRQFAVSIATAARRAADLTRQLLDFARRGRFRTEPVDLHALVRETVELLRHSIDRRIELRLCLDAPRCCILGDASQLQNALLNLGLNARDAMPEGGVLTFASAEETLAERAFDSEVEAGAFLRLEVIDSGQGMDEAVRRRLFEPFFTTKGPGKGTGLGLASVYGTVRSHHGAISVDSSPGRGSVFSLHLPLADQAVGPARAAAVAATGTGCRILVVDDEDVVRDLAVLLLADLGHHPTPCRDGIEAVALFAARPADVDLVILDLVMPRMSGREVLRRLLAVDPAVRVLISSGFSLDGEAQAALDEGACGFLQKPFRIEELEQGVRAALVRG